MADMTVTVTDGGTQISGMRFSEHPAVIEVIAGAGSGDAQGDKMRVNWERSMVTNDIKRGMRVWMNTGWFGVMADNMRGNIRNVRVFGLFDETGGVPSHDILLVLDCALNEWIPVEHTPEQIKLRLIYAIEGY